MGNMTGTDSSTNVNEALPWKSAALWLSVTQIVLFAAAVLWGRLRHISLQPLSLPGTEKEALYILGAFVLGIFNSLLADAALSGFIRRGSKAAVWVRESLLLPLFKDMPIPASIWLAALSACAEEFCFRLILLAETGPIISSIIFGLMHGGHRCLRWYIVWAALMGGFFCLLVNISGSLWPSAAMHFAGNLTSFILIRRHGQRAAVCQ